jgi:SagB-type dehydrogenase family enzyme
MKAHNNPIVYRSLLVLTIAILTLAGLPSAYALAAENEPAVIKLPPPSQAGGMPLMQALKNRQTNREFSDQEIPPQILSDLLWAAFGVNRPSEGKRTAPSSYNWQDITIYVFTPHGVWTYDAAKHQLLPQKTGDHRKLAGLQSYVWTAPLSLVYVSDFSKMTRGDTVYPERYKLMIGSIDAGHISQNVYLFCASEGLHAVARASVDKEQFAKAFELPDHMEVILGQTIGFPPEEEPEE